jgi:hypothetical protein
LFATTQTPRKSRKLNLPVTKFEVLAEVLLKVQIFCELGCVIW